ncbi:MAG: endonuclease III [Myxococcota bacterium]|nr:endonuclease III [Myxococcota bacterium]
MAKKQLPKTAIPELIAKLRTLYPDAKTELDHKNPFELLAATILSAQTTDKRVNMVTPVLFAKYPDAQALAKAEQLAVEDIVRTTGFYRNKAKSIIGMAKALVERHQGEVPRTLAELIKIPGAARKTANVVLGAAFGLAEGVVVDTHVQRLSQLIGLTRHDDVKDIEQDLMKLIPQADWVDFSHFLILHGRRVCIARAPQCDVCPLNDLCQSAFDPKVGYVPASAKAAKPSKKKVVVETKAIRAARAKARR